MITMSRQMEEIIVMEKDGDYYGFLIADSTENKTRLIYTIFKVLESNIDTTKNHRTNPVFSALIVSNENSVVVTVSSELQIPNRETLLSNLYNLTFDQRLYLFKYCDDAVYHQKTFSDEFINVSNIRYKNIIRARLN